ncbi:MAG: hypothetical protein ACOX6G_00645 [Christensenellales bacterium]|jgi:hypothetical protein
MKKTIALLSALILFIVPCFAQTDGYFLLHYETIELYYPNNENPTYTFICQYPVIDKNSLVAEQMNEFFRLAVTEFRDVTIPMYANDKILGKQSGNIITQKYEVTVNTENYFGTLMYQEQTINGEKKESLISQVFASTGPYAGETLTLRGALGEIGESSEQIAELILEDIFHRVKSKLIAEKTEGFELFTLETLSLDFFPEAQFFMNSEEDVVFYFLPETVLGSLSETMFVYSSEKISELLQ